jgi:predicted O-linked N-acetylglucosamine transferase (SPINDLY family)
LALDTPFYNGHTSGSDVLRAGVPLLTVTGSTFAGRVGASLLQAANLPELIAPDLATYEELAVTLALDANRLQTYRQRLQQPAPLFAPQATVRALEDLYRQMWTQALGAQR